MTKEKGIKLGTITRAKENMSGGSGKEINGKRYYTFEQAQETAKEQGLTIPTYQDFMDSGFTEELTEDNKKLADKLGLTLDGWCDSGGELFTNDVCGYVWSSSERVTNNAWTFIFYASKGTFDWNNRNFAFAVRPVLKTPVFDNLTIGQFSNKELWDELGKRLLDIKD